MGLFGPSAHDILNAQSIALKTMIAVAQGKDPVERYDIFGTKHAPDGVGYCSCWMCPKWSGIEWWQPKLKYQTKPLTRHEKRKHGFT